MKILKIQFKNINSLAGTNKIDFRETQFTNEGIFAITGKTGAGKTTILDAICLALYGKTPRVKISGSQNDVLTRGEKDCYSEVLFEVNNQVYHSKWSQEINKNGSLNSVKRLISNEKGDILSEKNDDKKIEEIIGLSFDQFTKVVLLAQGNFAAFLEAKAEEKGTLLEQMTGTAIYAEISKKIFERYNIEKRNLDNIQISYQSIEILTDEEIELLKNKCSEIEKNIENLEKELVILDQVEKTLTEFVKIEKEIEQTKEILPNLFQEKEKNDEIHKINIQKLEELKLTIESNEILFKKVRDLDVKIEEKNKLIQPLDDKIYEIKQKMDQIHSLLDNQKTENEQLSLKSNQLKIWILENKIYENLVKDFELIKKEHVDLDDLQQEYVKQEKEKDLLENEIFKMNELVEQNKKQFEKIDKSLSIENENLENKKSDISKILENHDLNHWKEIKEKITNYKNELNLYIQEETQILESQKNMIELKKNIETNELNRQEITEINIKISEILEKLDEKVKHLEENIHLTKLILSLDEHRKSLKDGEECPLCGALEHPFAVGNIPLLGSKEQDLLDLKKEKKDTSELLNENKIKLEKLITSNELLGKNMESEESILIQSQKNATKNIEQLKKINPKINLPESEDKISALEGLKQKLQNQYEKYDQKIKSAEEIEQELIKLRDEVIPFLNKEKEKINEIKSKNELNQQVLTNSFEIKKEILIEKQEKIRTFSLKLQNIYEQYLVNNLSELEKCLNDWNKNNAELELQNKIISELGLMIELNNKEYSTLKTNVEEKLKEKNAIEEEKQKYLQARIELFESKIVDDEELRMKESLKILELSKESSEKSKYESDKKYEKIIELLKTKELELQAIQDENIKDIKLDDIQNILEEKRKYLKEIIGKRGAFKEKLENNDENNKKREEKRILLENQKEIYQNWSNLNMLIGSSDGKKYRNFAQSLTFDYLIELSNQELLKMSDRYELKSTKDTKISFELSVLDKFHNNQERTVQNLSGGEKFIVSLALALGLSKMASHNIKIDTLFIDEGFGTLDSDYLDVALQALNNIQSEGKMIGIISHLTELKERIATHIQIETIGNGRSKIVIV